MHPHGEGTPGPILVELVGPSGVGKTSIARALTEAGGGEYVAFRPRRSLGVAGMVRSGMRAAVHFAAQAPRVPSRPWYRYRILVQLLAYADVLRRRDRHVRAAILDQGPIYLLSILQRALRGNGADSMHFLRYWHQTLDFWAHTIDLVVVLEAENAVLLRRIEQRGRKHPLLGGPFSDGSRFFADDKLNREAILNQLVKCNPSLVILRLSASEVSARSLADRIRGQVDDVMSVAKPRTGSRVQLHADNGGLRGA